MKAQILQTGYLENIKTDPLLKGKIAAANGKQISTVDRWLKENSQMLTTATTLAVIREHMGLTESEILTEEQEVVA